MRVQVIAQGLKSMFFETFSLLCLEIPPRLPYPLQYNSRILFSKMTFWGALNSNLVQICAFYSRKLPKNLDF